MRLALLGCGVEEKAFNAAVGRRPRHSHREGRRRAHGRDRPRPGRHRLPGPAGRARLCRPPEAWAEPARRLGSPVRASACSRPRRMRTSSGFRRRRSLVRCCASPAGPSARCRGWWPPWRHVADRGAGRSRFQASPTSSDESLMWRTVFDRIRCAGDRAAERGEGRRAVVPGRPAARSRRSDRRPSRGHGARAVLRRAVHEHRGGHVLSSPRGFTRRSDGAVART